MLKKYWIKCPICNGKTRVQVFHNTVLKDFPLFCPKCKLTHIIDVEKLEIVIKNTEKQLLLFRRKDIKMKRLPKYTPAEVRNDPYGFTYKEMSEVIGENEAKALYEELYKQLPRKKNLSMLVKNICKSSDTEKYVYELKDNKYIETVFIKRRDGGTVCVSTQVGCPVGCIFCESGRNGFVRNLTSSESYNRLYCCVEK